MARPVDTERREQLLAAAADHLRSSGDANCSLDAIAAHAGTSRRMLVHYFGTRDALVAEALDRCATEGRAFVEAIPDAIRDATPGQAVELFWQWLTADDGRSMRLFFSTSAGALTANADERPDYPAATTADWVRLLDTIAPDLPPGSSTLAVAAIRGLILDRLLTGDTERTDEAAALFARTLESTRSTPPPRGSTEG